MNVSERSIVIADVINMLEEMRELIKASSRREFKSKKISLRFKREIMRHSND